MRELDHNEVYFDKQGRLLKGRVYFFERGTTTTAPIYGADGTERANPVYTANGRLEPQVFLADRDYTIVWQQYIGRTDMQNDLLDEHWRDAGSADSLQPTMDFNIENKGLVTAGNVDALRNVNPAEITNGMVQLLGFAEPGDKPAVNYKWEAGSTLSDNGTTVIKSAYSQVGRFILIPCDEMDARHLGVFPCELMTRITEEQELRIASANLYANANNVLIKFSAPGYYALTNGTYSRFFCESYRAMFVVPSSHTVNVNQAGKRDIYFAYDSGNKFGGSLTLYGESLRLTYSANHPYIKWNAVDRFIIDRADQTGAPSEFNGSHVRPYFMTPASRAYTFRNISEIEGEPLPTGFAYTFINCSVSDRLFAGTPEWSRYTCVNCNFNIDNFVNVLAWANCMMKQGDRDLDFKNREGGTLELLGGSTITLRNTHLTGVVTNQANVEMQNVVVDSFTYSNLQVLTAKDSVIASPINVNTAKLDGCSVAGVGTSESVNVSLSARNTTFNGAVYSYGANLKDCVLMGDVYSYPQGAVMYFTLDGCNVAGQHKLKVDGTTAVNVAGTWKGNNFTAATPIILIGSNVADWNNYVYDGNTGTAKPGLGSHVIQGANITKAASFGTTKVLTDVAANGGKTFEYDTSLALKVSMAGSMRLFFIGKVVGQITYSGSVGVEDIVDYTVSGDEQERNSWLVHLPVSGSVGAGIAVKGTGEYTVNSNFTRDFYWQAIKRQVQPIYHGTAEISGIVRKQTVAFPIWVAKLDIVRTE